MEKQQDVGKRQTHHYYFDNGTMDFAAGWLLGYSQIGGLSVGEIYDCLNKIEDGNPESWADEFTNVINYQEKLALECAKTGDNEGAGIKYLACTQAARAVLHMCDPTTDQAMNTVQKMEDTFQKAMKMWETGLKSYNFDFNGKSLPSYITTPLKDEKPLFIVIGGGDTFREDLYFFGGSAALKRSYNVLLVDLPGQGKTPYDGMHFGRDTVNALSAILDKIDDMGFKGKKILSGYSGGGYFTTMLVAAGKKLDAWIASTPVFDFKLTIERAIPALIGKANNLNPMLELALKKYAWQFGPGGLTNILQTFADIGVADYSKINVPSLFLAGLSEDEEMIRQARIIYDALKTKQPASKIIEFDSATGADAHCQVNNLLWAQHQIFNWLKNSGI